MASITVKDFDNLDYTKIGAGVAVVGTLIYCMRKRYTIGKTALLTIVVGAAGAYLGYQLQNHLPND